MDKDEIKTISGFGGFDNVIAAIKFFEFALFAIYLLDYIIIAGSNWFTSIIDAFYHFYIGYNDEIIGPITFLLSIFAGFIDLCIVLSVFNLVSSLVMGVLSKTISNTTKRLIMENSVITRAFKRKITIFTVLQLVFTIVIFILSRKAFIILGFFFILPLISIIVKLYAITNMVTDEEIDKANKQKALLEEK